MSQPIAGFCWHVHHDILMEWCWDYEGCRQFIEANKPVNEHELRLRLFQPVKGQLPDVVIKMWQTLRETGQAVDEADRACNEAEEACPTSDSNKTCDEANETCQACYEAYRAWDEVQQIHDKAWQMHNEAIAAHRAEIEALHKIECPGCPWDGESIFPEKSLVPVPSNADAVIKDLP